MVVIKCSDLDFKLYKLDAIQKIHTKTIIPVTCFNAKDPVLIQTPKMFLPFVYDKSLKLTFTNMEYDDSIVEFKKVLMRLEKHLKKLFDAKYPQYSNPNPNPNPNLNKKYNWKFMNEDFFYADMDKSILIYDRFKKPIEEISSGIYVRCILNVDSIWISDNKIGINIKCYQIQTFGNDIHLTGYGFIDDLSIVKCEYKEIVKEVVLNPIECHEKYGKYFKMKKMGIPTEAIQQRMKLDGLIPDVINYDPDTDITKVKELDVKKVEEPIKINPSLLLAGINGLKKVDPKTLIKKKLKQQNKGWNPPTVEEINNILSNLRKAN